MAETRRTMMRRLYGAERCNIAEMSAYFGCTEADMRRRNPGFRPSAASAARLTAAGRELMAEGCSADEVAEFMAIAETVTPQQRTGDTPK